MRRATGDEDNVIGKLERTCVAISLSKLPAREFVSGDYVLRSRTLTADLAHCPGFLNANLGDNIPNDVLEDFRR